MPNITLDNKNTPQSYCVIVPTYNNCKTLRKVLSEVIAIHTSVIVVNDGSTDNTAEIIADFPSVTAIQYAQNKGKGNALKLAFRKASELGFDYAVTIDSDGQHYPNDIPKLVTCFENNPGHIIMGSRNMKQSGIPGKSSFGNSFSNFWFWAETGNKLSDTQTGFRAYPLKPIEGMRFYTKKFEFEIEILVRLAWKNVKFTEVPIKVEYPEDRVSHFRPFKDFTRISILNTVFVILALLFYLPRLFVLNFSFKKGWDKLKFEFTKDLNHPMKLSMAVALGLFFGILPIWGFQMIAAFSIASYYKLNRALVLIISNISIPPMMPLIIYGSFKFGALFVEEPIYLVALSEVDSETIYLQLKQYFIGATLLAITLSILGFLITQLIILFIGKGKKQL